MKFLVLVFAILICNHSFAISTTNIQPTSIQRIANASLTCPAKKWCDVTVNLSSAISSSVYANSGWPGVSVTNTAYSFNIKIKSGAVLSGSSSSIGASACNGFSSVSITHDGVVIAKTTSSLAGAASAGVDARTCSNATDNGFYFYSQEYYN